ncbi:MAG: FkbM family methyltransferase [Pirellulales bacterium]
MNHLFRFPHGLGDAVQFTVVLRHLQQLRPGWTIDIQARPGAHTLFDGLARASFSLDATLDLGRYDSVQDIPWPEPQTIYPNSPSTKAERSLRETFGIVPNERLCRYQVRPSAAAGQRARQYLSRVTGEQPDAAGRFPVAVIHYQGNSARRHKNLDERTVAALLPELVRGGVMPLLLDFDGRSGLLGQHTQAGAINAARDDALWPRRGQGDGAVLAALIAQARLFVGIDSGPGHIAGATDTPSIIVWRRHHPLHFYGLSPRVVHLLPDDCGKYLRGDQSAAAHYFAARYHARTYRDLKHSLIGLARELVGGDSIADYAAVHSSTVKPAPLLIDCDHWLRAEHRAADAAVIREVYLDDCYRCGELAARPRTIVDIGAHIGAFARRIHGQFPRAELVCVEANPANIAALQANAGPFATIIPAACTYERQPQQLLSTVFAGSANTGASRLTPEGNWSWDRSAYRPAGRVHAVTLEALQDERGWRRIDLLKLDCEGSELSILEQCDLSRIGQIVGEYHGREAFDRLIRRRFFDWRLRTSGQGEIGLFWLSPPHTGHGAAPASSLHSAAASYAARWNICSDCDQLQGACCTMTGLHARREGRNPTGRCPMRRWPGETRPDGHEIRLLQELLATPCARGPLLLRFPHGLGDHVQLTSVLLHMRACYPDLEIDVACRAGAESMLAGLCRRAIRLGQETADGYALAVTLPWAEPNAAYSDSPSTKAERSLRETFGLQPRPDLCRYEIASDPAAEHRVSRFLERISAGPRGFVEPAATLARYVLFHTQGRCGRRLKDLDDCVTRAAMQAVRAAGCLPLVLDWSGGNLMVREGIAVDAAADETLWESAGQGDGATLAALARRAALCVGIDSGPGHVFAATSIPAIIVWKLLHPVNYFAPTANVIHWVPATHGRFIRGRRHIGEAYFAAHYRHQIYDDLATELPQEISRRLGTNQ